MLRSCWLKKRCNVADIQMRNNRRDTLTPFMRRLIAARRMICKGKICTNVSSKCLLLYYCSNADNDGCFFKSTLEICLETGLAASTVYGLNAKWQTWGLLKIVKHDWRSGDANDYTIDLKTLEECSDRTQSLKADKIAASKQRAAERAKRYRARLKEKRERNGQQHTPQNVMHHTETSCHHMES